MHDPTCRHSQCSDNFIARNGAICNLHHNYKAVHIYTDSKHFVEDLKLVCATNYSITNSVTEYQKCSEEFTSFLIHDHES